MAMRGWPYTTFATGWYQIGWSHEFGVGEVKPAKYFDKDFVIFRAESGQMCVLDAFCLHYGAHLGYGGTVEGDAIRCPFHAWKWDCAGRNVDIPYTERGPVARTLSSYPVHESSGMIFMWYDHNGAEPSWLPPRMSEFDSLSYYPIMTAAEETGVVPQLQVENSVDFVHLKYVHGWNAGPVEIDVFEDLGHSFRTVMRGDLPTSKGVTTITTEITMHGVGLIFSHLSGVRDMGFVSGNTPIDHDRSVIRLSSAVARPDGDSGAEPDRLAKAMHQGQVSEILGFKAGGDRMIWEHMTYLERPMFMKEEVTSMRALRDWCAKLYPEPT